MKKKILFLSLLCFVVTGCSNLSNKSIDSLLPILLKENNKHLLRLDVNPSNIHENPDGSKITGSHYHLYSNNFEKVDRVATPIPKGMFPNLDTIIEAFIDFESYVNIKS